MNRIPPQVVRAAERRAHSVSERLAARIRAALPGVAAEVIREGVRIRGRRLAKRRLTDPILRWIGGLLR